MRFLRNIWKEESAATAVEYSIMLGFIMLVVIGSVASFGSGQNGAWIRIFGEMKSHGM